MVRRFLFLISPYLVTMDVSFFVCLSFSALFCDFVVYAWLGVTIVISSDFIEITGSYPAMVRRGQPVILVFTRPSPA